MHYSKKFLDSVMQRKNVASYNIKKLDEIIYKSYNMVYNGVCLDIDKTITINDPGDSIPDKMCESFARLLKYKNFICFITGRGSNGARIFLLGLFDKIQKQHPEIPFSSLKRITCITNNGMSLYYTLKDSQAELLQEEYPLVAKDKIDDFKDKLIFLRGKFVGIISSALQYNKAKLLDDSKMHSGSTSLRFPINLAFVTPELKDTIDDLISKIQCDKDCKHLFVSKGEYLKYFIIEIALTTKGIAVTKVEKFLGISESKMLRIGDQGDKFGNDFTMLNTAQGFSVKELSNEPYACFPVFSKNMKLLQNTAATVHLLNTLKNISINLP